MRRRRARPNPGAAALVLVALGVFFSGLTVHAVHDWRQSQRTQRAAAVAGLVTAASQTFHSSRGGGYYTSRYQVQGRSQAAGPWRTVVHAHGRDNRSLVGRFVQVKVDPRDRSYAEFPGRPGTRGAALALAAVMAVVADVLAVAAVLVWRRRRTRAVGYV